MRIRSLFLGLMLSAFAIFNVMAEPENLTEVKQELAAYHDSGQYDRDLASAVRDAHDYLQFRILQNQRSDHPKRLAMVMDIDETSLSNYKDMVALNFGGSLKEIKTDQDRGQDAVIPESLSLYQYAKANGVSVFFVTGRQEKERTPTVHNLLAAGYKNWDGLYLKPNDYTNPSIIPFKTAQRKKIEEMGYDVVLTIGDQFSDLKGGYADMSFKLPNPYYFLS